MFDAVPRGGVGCLTAWCHTTPLQGIPTPHSLRGIYPLPHGNRDPCPSRTPRTYTPGDMGALPGPRGCTWLWGVYLGQWCVPGMGGLPGVGCLTCPRACNWWQGVPGPRGRSIKDGNGQRLTDRCRNQYLSTNLFVDRQTGWQRDRQT